MTTRRDFIRSMVAAASLAPVPSWADAGSPAALAAARRPDASFALYGLGRDGTALFEVPLPGRGHAAAAHPRRPEAIAFARRPGTFAIVIDCRDGARLHILETAPGRHFYGHGAFSRDGRYLYTTENDFTAARGVIGIWDAANAYRRVGEFDSGGIGPHDIKRLPGGDILVIANGGIETHPDSGRTKLNLATMQPNLTYVGADGGIMDVVHPAAQARLNSIRHLGVSRDGTVAFGMQWQGGIETPPMAGLHRLGETARLLHGTPESNRSLNGYVGSITISDDGARVALTSPRGGRSQVHSAHTLALLTDTPRADVCGVLALGDSFLFSDGSGALMRDEHPIAVHNVNWDNHIIAL